MQHPVATNDFGPSPGEALLVVVGRQNYRPSLEVSEKVGHQSTSPDELGFGVRKQPSLRRRDSSQRTHSIPENALCPDVLEMQLFLSKINIIPFLVFALYAFTTLVNDCHS